MVQMTCPVCKNRCLLTVEQNGSDILVQGNKCARGELHAREELEGKGKIVTYHASTCFEQEKAQQKISAVPFYCIYGLTTFCGCPCWNARMLSSTICIQRLRACKGAHAMCGVTRQCGCSISGEL